jgi:hypothetical protein
MGSSRLEYEDSWILAEPFCYIEKQTEQCSNRNISRASLRIEMHTTRYFQFYNTHLRWCRAIHVHDIQRHFENILELESVPEGGHEWQVFIRFSVIDWSDPRDEIGAICLRIPFSKLEVRQGCKGIAALGNHHIFKVAIRYNHVGVSTLRTILRIRRSRCVG